MQEIHLPLTAVVTQNQHDLTVRPTTDHNAATILTSDANDKAPPGRSRSVAKQRGGGGRVTPTRCMLDLLLYIFFARNPPRHHILVKLVHFLLLLFSRGGSTSILMKVSRYTTN